MKATITNQTDSNFGKTFPVKEILHDKIICLYIYGQKVDYGISEVRLVADWSLGKEAVWKFRPAKGSILRDNTLAVIARLAAKEWGLKQSEVTRAVHSYVWSV
jgi:hypothetical protein